MNTKTILFVIGAALIVGGCAHPIPPSGYVTSVERYGIVAARTHLDPEVLSALLILEQLSPYEYQAGLVRIADDSVLEDRFRLSYERELRLIALSTDTRRVLMGR